MPIAISPINRKVRAALGEQVLQSRNELAVLGIDRADTAEVIVVLGNFKLPFFRDALPLEDLVKKR